MPFPLTPDICSLESGFQEQSLERSVEGGGGWAWEATGGGREMQECCTFLSFMFQVGLAVICLALPAGLDLPPSWLAALRGVVGNP